MNHSHFHKFENAQMLADALAIKICAQLSNAIEKRGKALLAVSGGSTPKMLFRSLSTQTLDWQNVTVTLVDERWVSDNDSRSNARMVKRELLVNNAKSADFAPLYNDIDDAKAGVIILAKSLQTLPLPFDCVLLGMGLDGHTASFFPGGDHLSEATSPNTELLVTTMTAPGAREPRVTFTLPPLINASFLALHIEGQEKLAILEKANKPGNAHAMPIRHILRQTNGLEIFWAP